MVNIRNALLIPLACGLAGLSHAQGVVSAAQQAPSIDYVNMNFQGRFRAAPRTQYARSLQGQLLRTELFADLDALKQTLAPDARMRQKYAKTLSSATRFTDELRNISVKSRSPWLPCASTTASTRTATREISTST